MISYPATLGLLNIREIASPRSIGIPGNDFPK